MNTGWVGSIWIALGIIGYCQSLLMPTSSSANMSLDDGTLFGDSLGALFSNVSLTNDQINLDNLVQSSSELKMEDLLKDQSIEQLFAAAINGSGVAIQTIATAITQQGAGGIDAFVDAVLSGGDSSNQTAADVITVLISRDESETASSTIAALSDRQLVDVIVKALNAASESGYIESLASVLAQAFEQGDTLTLVDASAQAVIQGQTTAISEAIINLIDDEDFLTAAFALARILSNNVDFAEFIAQFIQFVIDDDSCDEVAQVISQAQNFATDGDELIKAFSKNINFDDCLLQPQTLPECPLAECFQLDNCCGENASYKMGDICDADIGQKIYKFAGECILNDNIIVVWNPEFGLACHC